MDIRADLEEAGDAGHFKQLAQIVSGDQNESLLQPGDSVLKPDQRRQRLGGKIADIGEVENQQFAAFAFQNRLAGGSQNRRAPVVDRFLSQCSSAPLGLWKSND